MCVVQSDGAVKQQHDSGLSGYCPCGTADGAEQSRFSSYHFLRHILGKVVHQVCDNANVFVIYCNQN